MAEAIQIDSAYMGDSVRHRTLADLERDLKTCPPAPRDSGRVSLIVRKVEGGVRETPERVTFSPEDGIPGVATTQPARHTHARYRSRGSRSWRYGGSVVARISPTDNPRGQVRLARTCGND